MGCCGWKASDRESPADAASPEPVEVLEHHRAVAESALDAATCGRPLCRIGDGPDVSRPKYAEGGLAAVSELQRKLRGGTDTDALAVAVDLLSTWEAERQASEARGAAWIAYRNGGVAQLRAIVDDLAKLSSS
jgi:hypothetical protein